MKTAKSKVELVDHMGSDLTVVNAARVSFDKESTWTSDPYESWEDYNKERYKYPGIAPTLRKKDEKLIKYLAEHNHWSPFGHATVQFRIKAPIFVARQLVKHQVGLCWNEVSRRYVDSEPEFYFPDKWRTRPKNKKQGSGDGFIDPKKFNIDMTDGLQQAHGVISLMNIEELIYHTIRMYNGMINIGVTPEQARMILPQNMMTEWYWTGSLYAFSRIANLRIPSDAQEETRNVVIQISNHAQKLFPVSWKYLVDE